MSRTVRMVGLNQYIKAVQKKPAQVEQAVDREIKLSSLRIEKKSKQQSPFDTGWLSNNIYANVVRSMVAEVVSPVEYSIFIELGTRVMMAQPFLFPALKADWPLLQKRLNKLMRG